MMKKKVGVQRARSRQIVCRFPPEVFPVRFTRLRLILFGVCESVMMMMNDDDEDDEEEEKKKKRRRR